MINTNEHKCKGRWTREQGEARSIIDYVITSQENMGIIKNMEIDEEKQYRLYKIECQNKQIKKTCSDHNVILINIDFISPKNVSRKKKVITRNGNKKYKQIQIQNQTIIIKKEISKILETGELQESYNTWVDEVENTIKKVEKIKIKNRRKDISKIQQKRKKLRMELRTTEKTRKAHTVTKSKDPERAHYRQIKRKQSSKNLKGCRINKE